jgi:hypothetical protein
MRSQLANELAAGQADVLEGRGDTFGANDIRRRQGQFDQARTNTDRMADLEKLRGSVSPEVFAEMEQSLNALNDVSLEKLNSQFLTLEQTVGQLGIGAFKGFASELLKTGDVAGSLVNSLDNLAGSLIDILLNQAFQSLLGGALGGGASNAAMGDVVTQGLSGLTLANGNIPNFAGGNAIDRAFQRERSQSGNRPYLAVLNDKELVLSAKQSQKFMDMGLNQLVTMADGNIPPAGAAMAARGNNTINMPLSISVPSGQSAADVQAFAAGLQQQMRAIANSELNKALRPGGRLGGK